MLLDAIMQYNAIFIEQQPANNFLKSELKPQKKCAIFSCMDTRLVNMLESALGMDRGDAVIIKNSGNYTDNTFDQTIVSFIIAIFELNIEEIFVVGHFYCGVANSSSTGLISKMMAAGISYDAIMMVKGDLERIIDQYQTPQNNVMKVVSSLRNNPLIPQEIPIHGLMIDPDSGELSVLSNGYD